MSIREILKFLGELAQNNDRAWFAENKARYDEAWATFKGITERLIGRLSLFDEEIGGTQAKDCLFRIYRDTRFHDKTPYKDHFGSYIAGHGGRKSAYGGYYLHLQPGESFASPGIWAPEPATLKALREAVYENYEEFQEIIHAPAFERYYKDRFYDEGMLKTVPRGFPKDFEGAYYLKLKHYLVETELDRKVLESAHFEDEVMARFEAAYPLNRFLNYTVSEINAPRKP